MSSKIMHESFNLKTVGIIFYDTVYIGLIEFIFPWISEDIFQ